MKIGVLSRLSSRFSCFRARRLTEQKERLPVEDELARAAAPFEREIDGLEIKNFEGQKNAKALRRQLTWMRTLCELDRKFFDGFDLQSVTDALLETVTRVFPGSATTVWLVDGATHRLDAVACPRTRRAPSGPPRPTTSRTSCASAAR